MKRTVLLIILFILLSGCSEVRRAKAYKSRSQTRRANDIHQAAMAERAILAPTQIAAKENLIWTGTIAGIVLIVVTTGATSYYIVIFAIAKVKQVNLMPIPLDKATRQYPLIIAGGKRAYNPNTLASSDLRIDSLPYSEALRGSQAVQMIGAGEPRYKSYKEYEQELLLK